MKWIPIMAMGFIFALEAIALLKGVDGALFGIVIAALAGLGGYELRVLKNKRKGIK